MPSKEHHTSFRLTVEAKDKLSELARFMGLTRTAILEYLIRMGHREMKRQKRGGNGKGKKG